MVYKEIYSIYMLPLSFTLQNSQFHTVKLVVSYRGTRSFML